MNRSGKKKGIPHVHPATIDFYAKQTWMFAKSILWNNLPLSAEEIELSLHYIRQYYLALSPERFVRVATKYFIRSCKRVLKLKRNAHRKCVFTHPCIWLNPINPDGMNKAKKDKRTNDF